MTVDDLRDEINKGYPILGGEDAIISRCYKIMSEHIKELEDKLIIAEELISNLESDLNRSVAEVVELQWELADKEAT